MKGLLDRIQTTIYGVTYACTYSYNLIAKTAKFVYEISYNFNDYLSQSALGVSGAIDKKTPTFIFDKNSVATRTVLTQSMAMNLGYAGLNALYAGPVKNLLSAMPYMDNPYVAFSVDMLASASIYGLWMLANNRYDHASESDKLHPHLNNTLDLIPSMLPARLKLNLMVSNKLLAACMTSAVTKENKKTPTFDPYKPCNCLPDKKVKANFMSVAYYLAEQATIYSLAKLLPYGDYWTLPLQALSTGKALMEYKLSALGNGMCLHHRREILNQNNLFALGFGGIYLGLSEMLTRLLMSKLGIAANSPQKAEIKFGVNGFLSHWFIMQTILQDRQFPGTKDGVEVFYYSRYLMKKIMQHSLQLAANMLGLINKLFGNAEVSKLAVKLTLTKDMQNLQTFLRTPPARLYLDMNTEWLRQLVETLRATRESDGSSPPTWILASKGLRYFLCFFFGKEWEISLYRFDKDLQFVRPVPLVEFAKMVEVAPVQPTSVVLDANTTVAVDEDNFIGKLLINDYMPKQEKRFNILDEFAPVPVSADEVVNSPLQTQGLFSPVKAYRPVLQNNFFAAQRVKRV